MSKMDGREFVRKSLDIFGGTQAEFASACGVSQSLISQFLSGSRKPSWKTCLKIEKLTKGQVTRYQLRPDIFTDDDSQDEQR